MRNEKSLINLLKGLVGLLADEAARNPEFGARLDELLAVLTPPKPEARPKPAAQARGAKPELPADYAVWVQREEPEFRLWLRSLPIPELRAVIRKEDLDAGGKTAKWKSAEKLASFIAEGLAQRRLRGRFLGGD